MFERRCADGIGERTGAESEMLRFTIRALPEGSDALGEVIVRLKENGLIALGRGSNEDIITASAKACINSLNRMEYLKENPVGDRQEL